MTTIQDIISELGGTEATWDDHTTFCFEDSNHRGKRFFLGAKEAPGKWRLVRYTGCIGECATEIGVFDTKGECKGAARKRVY